MFLKNELMKISIYLNRKEIVNDVIAKSNIIGRSLVKDPQTEELAGEIMTPDSEETKPLIARALTEAFGEVKRICQKYLIYGRLTDDNRLEKIDETNKYKEEIEASPLNTECKYQLLTGIKYIISVSGESDKEIKVMNDEENSLYRGKGNFKFTYTPVREDEHLIIYSTSTNHIMITYQWGDFGKYEIYLDMPESFNIGITETVKNCAHKMMVDYVMSSILKDQLADKSKEYASQFIGDQEALKNALISRKFYRRPLAADWS